MHDTVCITDFGYRRNEQGILQPVMMTQPAAAPELLNNIVCECLPGDCQNGQNCSCSRSEQSCTAECKCEGAYDTDSLCTNTYNYIHNENVKIIDICMSLQHEHL